jgi:hypothetical protein
MGGEEVGGTYELEVGLHGGGDLAEVLEGVVAPSAAGRGRRRGPEEGVHPSPKRKQASYHTQSPCVCLDFSSPPLALVSSLDSLGWI